MRIILATNNIGKLKEFKSIFGSIDYFKNVKWCSKSDLNINSDPDEISPDFKGNAFIKANDLWERTNDIREDGDIVISDDSGLIIDYLNGEPGVKSARYLGDITYPERFKNILDRMKDAKGEDRHCKFVTTLCMIREGKDKTNEVQFFEGSIDGEVSYEAKGDTGFGYDPIFYLRDKGKTVAELSDKEKNAISHRRLAINKLIEYITKDS